MVVNIYVFILLASLVYAYTNYNNEFNATASALQQIWSGDCRLSCRQSDNSRFSGLSGLTQGVFRGSTELDRDREGQPAFISRPGPSSCVCETCPCAILEVIIRICRPAIDLYSKCIELLSANYYELVKMATDLCIYLDRVMNCGVSCQRQSQLTALKLDSAENINFTNATAVKNTSKRVGKDALNLKPSTIYFRTKSEDELGKTDLHSSPGAQNIALNLPSDSLKPVSESKESLSASRNCSKCIEKGKVCMGNCPRVNEKKK